MYPLLPKDIWLQNLFIPLKHEMIKPEEQNLTILQQPNRDFSGSHAKGSLYTFLDFFFKEILKCIHHILYMMSVKFQLRIGPVYGILDSELTI